MLTIAEAHPAHRPPAICYVTIFADRLPVAKTLFRRIYSLGNRSKSNLYLRGRALTAVFCREHVATDAAAAVPRLSYRDRENAMTAADRRMYWDLFETLQWIGTRDERRITVMGDIDENNRTPLAMPIAEAVLDRRPLLLQANDDFTADCEPVAWQAGRKSLQANESGIIAAGQALNYLLQQVHSRRIRMTAIKCDRYRVRQVPVPPAELDDLEFRINSDHRLTIGLWSRSRNTLMWRSAHFLRADVMHVWPARKKKAAAVSSVILQHLRTITTPATPLTRADAQRRCLAEVPDAFPEAFNKAWAILDPSHKRGRGRHRGRRTELGLEARENPPPAAEF